MHLFRATYALSADSQFPTRIGADLIEAPDDLSALMIADTDKHVGESVSSVERLDLSVVEHRPFVGDLYEEGIGGKRIAIIGYSHYAEPDHAGVSEDVIARFRSGEYKDIQFFWSIMGFFGSTDLDFWRRVMFFNYIPSSIGGDDDKYAHGTPEQMRIAKDRFVRLLVQYRPDAAVVLTKKPRWAMPDLAYEPFMDPSWDFQKAATKIGPTTVYRLRHPQGARYDKMRPTIEAIVAG